MIYKYTGACNAYANVLKPDDSLVMLYIPPAFYSIILGRSACSNFHLEYDFRL